MRNLAKPRNKKRAARRSRGQLRRRVTGPASLWVYAWQNAGEPRSESTERKDHLYYITGPAALSGIHYKEANHGETVFPPEGRPV